MTLIAVPVVKTVAITNGKRLGRAIALHTIH